MKVLLGNMLRAVFRPFVPPKLRILIHEKKQLREFDETVRRLERKNSGNVYSEDGIRGKLAEKPGKRPLRGENGKIHVAGFGFKDWEPYGLWPSFSRISDFTFIDYGELIRKHNTPLNGPNHRPELCRAFLSHLDKLDKEKPVSLVFIYVDTDSVPPELFVELDRRGIWSVLMGLDDKHRFQPRYENGILVGQETVTHLVDLIWTTWKTGTDLHLACGGNPWYAPEAADPAFHCPASLERDIDVLFIGRKYGEREYLVKYLRDCGFDVAAYGKGWTNGFVDFEESVRLTNRAKVVLGVGGVRYSTEIQHLKGRDFEVPMCGALYLTTYNPELADWYVVGKEILCYGSFRNCAEILYWILRRPDKQEEIRQAALARSLRDHTWEKRLRRMLALFPDKMRSK